MTSELTSMDYAQFIKKLRLPDGFRPPTRLTHDGVVATAITRAHLHEDVEGINASLSLIEKTRAGGWPTEPVTEEQNFVDLVWHELEFRERSSLTYAVFDDRGIYVGCCYLYPMGRRTALTETLAGYDVDVSWWVTPAAHERGDYDRLYRALRHWGTVDFPFTALHFSNRIIPG